MRLRKHSIQNLIDSINLQDHMSRYLEVRRSGNNMVAKCPFHADSSPSCCIYVDHYHCFSCKAHGSIIDYEMHRTGANFREAVEHIAEQYQIQLEFEQQSPADTQKMLQFEKQNKIFQNLEELFKKNTEQFLNEVDNALAEHFKSEYFKYIEIYYTGSQTGCKNDLYSIGAELPFGLDISERFALPYYKDNGRLCGFEFSEKVVLKNLTCSFNISQSFFKKLQYVPYINSFFACYHWSHARTHISKLQNIIVVLNLKDLLLLLKSGVQNVVYCSAKNFDIPMLKIFSKRVKDVFLLTQISQESKGFIWRTFIETITYSSVSLKVLASPSLTQSMEQQLSKIVGERENSFFNWINKQANFIYDEILYKLFESVPEFQRKEVFISKVFPHINKISNIIEKKELLENIAQTHFHSSSQIFFEKSQTMDTQKNISTQIKHVSKEDQKNQINHKQTLQNEKEFLAKTIQFYSRILLSNKGLEARDYLEKRGIHLDHIQKWNLGFAPGSNELARKMEQRTSADKKLAVELGLIKGRKLGQGYYDFFYDRIVIPILGHDGSPVALSGRKFLNENHKRNGESPKYINSPESNLFSKSKILYNFYAALPSIVSNSFVFVVEGYMDCISLVNAGIFNVVAVMGTALTKQHMEAITQVTRRVVLCFDTDDAGIKASKRSFSIAFPFLGFDLECVLLPQGKDPDDFVSLHGVDAFVNLTNKRISLFTQICEWLYIESQGNSQKFRTLLKEQVFPVIAQHTSQDVQNEALLFLCEKYFPNLDPRHLHSEIESKSYPQMIEKIRSQAERSNGESYWTAVGALEVKFLFALVHSNFLELPIRLKNIVEGVSSEVEEDGRICALALKNQMSEQSFSVLLELLVLMMDNPQRSPHELNLSELAQVSAELETLLAYAASEPQILFKHNKHELLKANLIGSVSMVSLKDIWDLKNSGFLKFQLRNVKLSLQEGVLSALIAEFLLNLELEYIDNALKAFSSFHFDDEIDKQFQSLVSERARRLIKFGNFESFCLQ